MDRDTLKNLLMTTSVVAIVAATGSEAQAAVCVSIPGGPGVTRTTNANCILIDGVTITGNVVIAPSATIGTGDASGTAILVHNSVIQGALTNNGTITPTVPGVNGTSFSEFGIIVNGNSTITNGLTNGATTGVIDIAVSNTTVAATNSANGIGIDVHSSLFAGNVVNNGVVDVAVLADPSSQATADAHGILVTSTSFVGNVINTGALDVFATAIAGATDVASSTAVSHAEGVVVRAGSFSTDTAFGGAGTQTFSAAFSLRGNVSNSGIIFASGTSFAEAGGNGALTDATALATAQAAGLVARGGTFTGNVANTGLGTIVATISDNFIGNLVNTGTIEAAAGAFATAVATSGTALVNVTANVNGMELVGNDFTGNATNSGAGSATATVLAAFTGNITNSRVVFTGAEGFGTAVSATGSAQANVDVTGRGILAEGSRGSGSVTNTGAGNLTAVLSDVFTGNITNNGTLLGFFNSAIGTATSGGTTGVAAVNASVHADGISVIGASFSGDLVNGSSGNISATLNSQFIGNISNTNEIVIFAEARGDATAFGTSGLASVTGTVNAAGINVAGGLFSGNVVNTGVGSIATHFSNTFHGTIANSGRITVFGSAFATQTATGTNGSATADLTAIASGIRVLGATFAGNVSGGGPISQTFDATFLGNISNTGGIFAFGAAFDSATVPGSTGVADLSLVAKASGIEYIGAVTSGNASQGNATFFGNIVNTGTIEAIALADATVTTSSGVGSTVQVTALANGMLVVASSFSGAINNNGGSIFALAIAGSDVIGSTAVSTTTAFASANGIHLDVGRITGNVSSSGLIHSLATAFSDDAAQVTATANGIRIDSNTFTGNVTHSGGIFAAAAADATALGSTAFASAGGIVVSVSDLFTGTVSNTSGSEIIVAAAASAPAFARATGVGIYISSSTFSGDALNSGLISVNVGATSESEAIALAAGILIGETPQNGQFVTDFTGNINNAGVISVGAEAITDFGNTAFALAGGIVLGGNTNGSTSLQGLSSWTGNVTNSGTISATANAVNGNHAETEAFGVLVAASTANGNISNSGTIEVLSAAVSTLGNSALANAAGIAVLGGTSAAGFANFFTGNVTSTSSGMIVAQAFANASGTFGEAHAHAAGILVAGAAGVLLDGDTATNANFIGVTRFTGNISNSGIISASATSTADSLASSAGFGIEALFSSFTGDVTNGGTITAIASATVTDGTANATAGGIVLAGFDGVAGGHTNDFIGQATLFSGNVTNSGSIGAAAVAVGAFEGSATAFGIFLDSSSFVGNITNTSTGVITANAFASVVATGTVFSTAFAGAFAAGIETRTETFFGNVSNAGTIMATATAISGGEGFNGNPAAGAEAFGIDVDPSTLVGNVTNTGLIVAAATASNVDIFPRDQAFAVAEGAGIGVFASTMVGTIANSGGTIMAFGTVNAVSTTFQARAHALMSGILVDVSTFIGNVTNSGVIETGVTATATGTGSGTQGFAIAAGIGVNGVSTTSTFRTSTFVGNITNTGTIMVTANASMSSSILNGGTAMANATGIRVFASTFIGNINNTGSLVSPSTASGNVANTGGHIFANATATAFSGGEAIATARGILVGGLTASDGGGPDSFLHTQTFLGNIGNSGTIMAFASASAVSSLSGAARAEAEGIAVLTTSYTGNVTNSAGGLIYAGAQVTGNSGFASATGIYLDGQIFRGDVTNNGTISAWALASVSLTNNRGGAAATGINQDMSTFVGNIVNTGRIAASATAISGGIFQRATAFAKGIDTSDNSQTFLGNVTNSGTITAFASAVAGAGLFFGGGEAFAYGIESRGTFIGDITNQASGVIASTAVAIFGGGGFAVGVYDNTSTFHGNITNSGKIFATGSGVNAFGIAIRSDTFIGNITNNAGAVVSADSDRNAIGVLIDPDTFAGNINNAGLIIALTDSTGIKSTTSTFLGAITNTGSIIGTGGTTDIGINVTGSRIQGGITNFGTIQGGFASIDLFDEEGANTDGTVVNQSAGLLMGDVLLSENADTLNVFGGKIKGNISGNMSNAANSGGFGNNDFVNFDMGLGHTFSYQYKITNINTVDLTSGMLVLEHQQVNGTTTLGPGNIDPVNTFNQSPGSTLGIQVTVTPHVIAGPNPPNDTITVTGGYGSVAANTVNLSTGGHFLAIELPDYYANTNIFPDVIVGVTSLTGAYDPANVTSTSPLFDTFLFPNLPGTPAGSDTLVLNRREFNHPKGVPLTPNENALGNELDGLYKTGNGAANTLLPPIFALTAPQYAPALKSMDGETILERPDLWQTVMDSILHRLSLGDGFSGQGVQGAMLRHGPIQVASAGQSDWDGTSVAQVPAANNGVVQPWSAWIRGYGAFGSGDSTINAPAFDENREGAIGGVDYRLNDNWLVGGAFNYAHGEVTFNNGVGKNKQDTYQFAGYTKWQQGAWYADGIVGGGFTSNNSTRLVGFSMFGPVFANGSYSGETFSAYGETGIELRPGNSNLKLIPLAGVGYNYIHYDDFTETGGGPADLTLTNQTTNNLYSVLGARAQAAINIGTSAPLVPELRVTWQHEFLNANQEMNSAFAASPNAAFNIQGSKFSRDSIIAGVGISNNVSPDMKVFLDYDAKIQSGYFANAISAGLRWSFGAPRPMPPPAAAAPAPMPAAQPAAMPASQAQVFVVYFDFDKSVLTPDAVSIIRQAVDAYKKTGAVTIKIDGYTDLSGTAQYNLGLSKRRADAVRAELVKDGVPTASVAEAWHGEDNPAVPTPNGVREPRNRRVTLALP